MDETRQGLSSEDCRFVAEKLMTFIRSEDTELSFKAIKLYLERVAIDKVDDIKVETTPITSTSQFMTLLRDIKPELDALEVTDVSEPNIG